jgi:hypothetical protein
MSIKDLFDFLISLVTAPAYYNSYERAGSNTATAVALLCAIILGVAVRRRASVALIGGLLVVAVVAGLFYAHIADSAGMWLLQTVCRVIISAAIGFCAGTVVPGGTDGGGNGDRADQTAGQTTD